MAQCITDDKSVEQIEIYLYNCLVNSAIETDGTVKI